MTHPVRTITARSLLTAEGEIAYPVIEVGADGAILAITSDPAALKGETSVLAPMLVDIHTHGSRGVDVMNAREGEFLGLQRFLERHGVGHYLPTTVTAPVEFTLRALERMAAAVEGWCEGDGARPAGIHMEGPFLSHTKRGMHPAEDLQPPSVALFERFQQAARGHIRLVTIAPEDDACRDTGLGAEPGAALELIRYLEAKAVRCSIGHTNASAQETMRAIEAGAASATHTFNAMRPLDHREPGVLGTVLDQPGLFADLICDGVHVAPECVRLWWRAKGPGRAILITDALSAAGMPDGEYLLGSSGVRVVGGRALVAADLLAGRETLAGSLLTLDRAVENLMRFTGASVAEAIGAASATPSALLGRRDWAALGVGLPATMNRHAPDGSLLETFVRGASLGRGATV